MGNKEKIKYLTYCRVTNLHRNCRESVETPIKNFLITFLTLLRYEKLPHVRTIPALSK